MIKCVDNIGSLLNSVLRWLENEDDNEKWWQLQTQVAQLCLLELDLLFKPEILNRLGERDGSAANVISNLRSMVEAMRNRNRTAALDCGRRAVRQLMDSE